jgi:hypothetical protein
MPYGDSTRRQQLGAGPAVRLRVSGLMYAELLSKSQAKRGPRVTERSSMLSTKWMLALVAFGASGDPGIDFFETKIRPVLATQCYACHSSATKTPLGGLQLDTKAGIRAGGKSGPAVVPGNPGASLLLQAIEHAPGAKAMPPSGKLGAGVVADFRRWIETGAADPRDGAGAKPGKANANWWSLRPLARPAVPQQTAWVRNPIDAFIQSKLTEKGLSPSAEASKAVLARRVWLDLTGLPPTAEELAAFVADSRRDAYEQLVERLLASPRYGERWARHWMDVAHFSETNGYETDQPRENAWHYRDYLIEAFRKDKPYARFIEEQVAGDVLFPDDPKALVATAFLAAGPWDQNTIPAFQPDRPDVIRAYYLDRDDIVATVMSAFTSTTVHCARCHDHKFDPISHDDHYSLQAVFAGLDRMDRPFDTDPGTNRKRQTLIRTLQALDRGDAVVTERLRDAGFQEKAAAWGAQLLPYLGRFTPVEIESVGSKRGAKLTVEPGGVVFARGSNVEAEVYRVRVRTGLKSISSVRLEMLPDERLPLGGPGQTTLGSFSLAEVRAKQGEAALTFCEAKGDYRTRASSASAIVDGRRETQWKNYWRPGEYRQAVLRFTTPVDGTAGAIEFELEQSGVEQIGKFRLSVSADDPIEIAPEPIDAILRTPSAERSAKDREELAAHYLRVDIERQLAALPKPQYVYAASTYFEPAGWVAPVPRPRPVQVLERGEIEKPLREARPGALSVFSHLPSRFALTNPADEAEARAALARWLSDSRNPLTWRSIVNRVWHYHFGRGIVDTPNDFGRMGGAPTHPELLEWMAAWFRDGGGSMKSLHRLIVTSATYRQASTADAAKDSIDAENRYLWRMPRTRLDAEAVRDAVLQVAGRLDLTEGGPSVKQAVMGKNVGGAPTADYDSYDWNAQGANRRTIYRFLMRTLSDPFMDALNYPNMSMVAPVRTSAVGPLQALALLNNPFMTKQSEYFAGRLEAAMGKVEEQVAEAYRRALLREATVEEVADAVGHVRRHGLASFCRLLFNSNEFMYVN